MTVSDAEKRQRNSPYCHTGVVSTVPRRCGTCGATVVPVKVAGRVRECLACYVRSLSPREMAALEAFDEENEEIETANRKRSRTAKPPAPLASKKTTSPKDPTPVVLAAMVAKVRRQKIAAERKSKPHVDGGSPGIRAYRIHSMRSTKRTSVGFERISA